MVLAVMDSTYVRDWPPVSVIMPALNEERYLAAAVTRVLDQDYHGDLELVLALAPSKDRTGEIAAALAQRERRLRLVDNPAGGTPNGLNAAIAAARYNIIVRVDGRTPLSDSSWRPPTTSWKAST